METAENRSLVLLDEAEIALHPRVQVNLVRYLEEKAKEKDLYVFISTHSPTLIKATNRNNIILLNIEDGGIIKAKNPCYQAEALGGIDFEESNTPDYVFFVEDDMARIYLKRMVYRYFSELKCCDVPMIHIYPVGGYRETAKLTLLTRKQLLLNSKVFAFLDEDSFEELDKKPKLKEILDSQGTDKFILSLLITPEVKFVEVLTMPNEDLNKAFKKRMHCEISSIVKSEEYTKCNSTKERDLAKDRFRVFLKKCVEFTGDSEELIKYELINLIVDSIPIGNTGELLGYAINNK